MVTIAGSDLSALGGGHAPSIPEQREAMVREHLESEQRSDFDTTTSTFVGSRYEVVPTGQVYQGREAVSGFYKSTREAFPDQRNQVADIHHAGDTLIVEFDVTGTHLGRFQDLEPTGRSFRCRMVALFTFDGLEVTSERVYFDSSTIVRQLAADTPVVLPDQPA